MSLSRWNRRKDAPNRSDDTSEAPVTHDVSVKRRPLLPIDQIPPAKLSAILFTHCEEDGTVKADRSELDRRFLSFDRSRGELSRTVLLAAIRPISRTACEVIAVDESTGQEFNYVYELRLRLLPRWYRNSVDGLTSAVA